MPPEALAEGQAAAEHEPPAVACFRGRQDRRGTGGTVEGRGGVCAGGGAGAATAGSGPTRAIWPILAEQQAKLPVAYNRQHARREARPCGQEVYLYPTEG